MDTDLDGGMILQNWIEKKLEISLKDRKELENWQLLQLQSVILYGKSRSSFYRKHFEGYAIPKSLAEFQKYPLIKEHDLAEKGLQMLCVSQGEIERVITLFTSGTSGIPKRLYFTGADQELTIDFFANGMNCVTEKDKTVMILLPCEKEGGVGDLLQKGLTRMGARSVPYGMVTDIAHCVKWMQKEEVTSLVGVPVQVLALAAYCQTNGIRTGIESVLLSTDHLSGPMKRKLKKWLCSRIYNHFGMTEMGLGGAIDCDRHEGMHIRENDLYLEVIDPQTGATVPDGTEGELVLTTLTRKEMPLIRYRTGDRIRIKKDICSCKSILRSIEETPGRFSDKIGIGKSTLTTPEVDEVVFEVEDVIDYRLNLEKGNLKLVAACIQRGGQDISGIEAVLTGKINQLLINRGLDQNLIKTEVRVDIIKDRIWPYQGKRILAGNTV